MSDWQASMYAPARQRPSVEVRAGKQYVKWPGCRYRCKKALFKRLRRTRAGTYAQRSIANRRFKARIKMHHMYRQLPMSVFKFARLV